MSAGGGLAEGRAKSVVLRGADRLAGLAWARAWRIRNKPYFDALYGPDRAAEFCAKCGRRR